MGRGVIALLAAAGTLGAAALAWSAPAVSTGPQWPATVSPTSAPSPDHSDDYCMQDPNWYLCQHSREKPIMPSSHNDRLVVPAGSATAIARSTAAQY
jgi:hypothetical protein